ncbi:MAG: type II toxin-antitoxin system VapB family antitoxin [Gemmatimonadota bacterium]|jgi:antitoxin VapB
MALNIKNSEVEALAAELAEATGESKTEAIRKALLQRRARLRFRISDVARSNSLLRFLEREVWPRVPEGQLGKAPGKAEKEEILGYGRSGV